MMLGGGLYGLRDTLQGRWAMWLLRSSALLCAVFFASCGGCATINLTEGLSIEVRDRELGPIAPGDYEITVVADGVPLTLSIRVTETSASCLPNGLASCTTSTVVDERILYLHSAGLGPTQLSVVSSYEMDSEGAGGPETATIQLVRAGAVLGEVTVSPTYSRVDYPGAGCGFATQASVDFHVATLP